MIDVATFGETMGTIRFTDIPAIGGRTRASFAGAETNVAIGLSRLGYSTAWVGTVGLDTFGHLILRGLRAEQVDEGGVVETGEYPTGLMVSREAGLGSFAVDYHRTGSAGRQFSDEQIDYMLSLKPKVIHLTGITPALGDSALATTQRVIREASEHGVKLSFDVNYRSRLWTEEEATPVLAEIASHAHIVFGGPEEISLITGEADIDDGVDALLRQGVSRVVYKNAGSATSCDADGQVSAPGLQVPVKDTIGAGDGFVAGYLSGCLDDLPALESLQRAHLCGAFAVGSVGDWEGAPTRQTLKISDLGDGEVLR
ncbi:Uncharacterized sugar kinase ydjH [Trueperella bialowiezensis]|uniref:Uncharacterized sugar kinase ydjH n=2 Tax=Trueperella bialowiezensis TaxID=312285 RepID=A0A448PCK1_9ACTO|nr:Uncharacterized sugar kinase ydjH [Trueperella bialowiezensis]